MTQRERARKKTTPIPQVIRTNISEWRRAENYSQEEFATLVHEQTGVR